MPDRVIEIPGVGNIAFPDTMDDAAISAAAGRLYEEKKGEIRATVGDMTPMPSHGEAGRAPATLGNVLRANPAIDVMTDVAGGLRAGAASTMFHGGDAIRRLFGMERVIDRPEVQASMTAPDSLPGKVGFLGEQAAEFAVPLTKLTKATKGASFLTRMGTDAAASAGVAGVQSGADPVDMGVAAAGGAVLPFVGAGARAAGRAAAGAREDGLGGAIAGAVRTASPAEPRQMLVQALKPRATRVHFESNLDLAMPELKAAEVSLGAPIQSVDDLLKATKAAKTAIQGQLNTMRGAQREISAEVDLSSVADAMAASIPKKVQLENPKLAARLVKAASVYRRAFSLDEAETLLRETNAELDSFYAMFPQAQRVRTTANPATAALDAQATALRDAIYRKLDDPGQGAAARELNRRYGALMEVEGEAFRRSNVAKRQQPESLSEQIGAVRAAGEMARGTWKVLHGNPMGLADIAAGTAGRSTAKALKDSQTTDALIRRAFAAFRGQPAPVAMPPRRQTRGLLGPGPRVTPPPRDPSFVRGVPAQPALSGRPRMLPSSTAIVTPSPADPSFVRGVRAVPAQTPPPAWPTSGVSGRAAWPRPMPSHDVRRGSE